MGYNNVTGPYAGIHDGVSSSGGGLEAGVCLYNRLHWRIQALRLGGRTFFGFQIAHPPPP